MPMSRPSRIGRRDNGMKRGFTLVEILVVLAIFALATAVIMPSTGRLLDQTTAHAVFFEFQRDVSALRRQANRTGHTMRLIDPDARADAELGDQSIRLRAPWRYTIAPALVIDEGGGCGVATVNLLDRDTVVMTLRTADGDCNFSRQQTTAVPHRELSSQ